MHLDKCGMVEKKGGHHTAEHESLITEGTRLMLDRVLKDLQVLILGIILAAFKGAVRQLSVSLAPPLTVTRRCNAGGG